MQGRIATFGALGKSFMPRLIDEKTCCAPGGAFGWTLLCVAFLQQERFLPCAPT